MSRENIKTLHGTPLGEHLEIDPATGMQKDYVVLTEEERAKGFVRPVRRDYIHTGKRPKHPLRDLTSEERERYPEYVKFEEYPASSHPTTGRFWSAKDLNSGCGFVTTMSVEIAESYARNPRFYSGTMCVHCKAHFDVGAAGEFIWNDGSGEKVGT